MNPCAQQTLLTRLHLCPSPKQVHLRPCALPPSAVMGAGGAVLCPGRSALSQSPPGIGAKGAGAWDIIPLPGRGHLSGRTWSDPSQSSDPPTPLTRVLGRISKNQQRAPPSRPRRLGEKGRKMMSHED